MEMLLTPQPQNKKNADKYPRIFRTPAASWHLLFYTPPQMTAKINSNSSHQTRL